MHSQTSASKKLGFVRSFALLVAAFAAPGVVRAEISELSGSASARVDQLRDGVQTDFELVEQQYPGAGFELPLQVAATLQSLSVDIAAASAAAQLADPATSSQPNPEEIALNLALVAAEGGLRYRGSANVEEVRTILYRSEDFLGVPEGTVASVRGRLFLDGALTVFANGSAGDLSGNTATLRVEVIKEVDGAESQTLLTGTLRLSGNLFGNVDVFAEGAIPTGTLIVSEITLPSEDLSLFKILIIPNLTIDYDYEAKIGESFRLRAKISVEAENPTLGVGVAALIGTPVDSLRQVLNATRGEASSAKIVTALQTERSSPTGTLLNDAPPPAAPLCGLLGFEMALVAPLLLMFRTKYRGTRA